MGRCVPAEKHYLSPRHDWHSLLEPALPKTIGGGTNSLRAVNWQHSFLKHERRQPWWLLQLQLSTASALAFQHSCVMGVSRVWLVSGVGLCHRLHVGVVLVG